jgi:hypothetical protein
MSIAEVIAHQDKLVSIVVCRCKVADRTTSANCVCRKNGNYVHLSGMWEEGGGVNTQCTLCEIE